MKKGRKKKIEKCEETRENKGEKNKIEKESNFQENEWKIATNRDLDPLVEGDLQNTVSVVFALSGKS